MLVASDRVTIGRPTYAIKAPSRRRVLRSVVADGRRIWILSMDALPSLETLFGLTEWRTHDGREIAPRYATAWALVHLLVLGAPDLAPRFQSYLSGLQHPGAHPRELFVKLFEGVPLQDRLNEHLRRGRLEMLQRRSRDLRSGRGHGAVARSRIVITAPPPGRGPSVTSPPSVAATERATPSPTPMLAPRVDER
jgi:hypothetical protein